MTTRATPRSNPPVTRRAVAYPAGAHRAAFARRAVARRAIARLAALAVMACVVTGCAAGGVATTPDAAGSPGASVIQVGSPLVGKPAPPLVGTTLDGAPFDLASLRGSPVLVNFWASWCGPCREEFPLLAAAEKAHAAEGLQVVGVLFKDDAAQARTFVAEEKADWPTVADPARTIAQPWAVLAPPQTYFIDRAGIVRDLQIGQVRDAAELDSILAAILK